MYVALIEHIHN